MASIHQVNHPGQELNIIYNRQNKHSQDYYFFQGSFNRGVRLWNRGFINGKPNSHKRKFIEHSGKYVKCVDSTKEEEVLLRFWGEYEGHSEFELLKPILNLPYWNNPLAVHRPFFCAQNINDQNTDPFIFGDNFYYAVCKKTNLKNITNGDIILFGSEFGTKKYIYFFLDTLFVVENAQSSILSDLYDEVYQESTLKRIGISNCTKGTLPIHVGKKFSIGGKIFSFFPAQIASNNVFGRPIIDVESLGLQKPGARTGAKSRELNENESIEGIWNSITDTILKQGYILGTHAESLKIFKQLP
jgi:hypothetical protein